MKKNNILKKLVLTTIALLLSCNISGLALGVNDSSENYPRYLYRQNEVFVNDDYNESIPDWNVRNFSKIQDAIDAVDIGWIINVCNGTYNETLLIKQKITLNGTNEDEYGNDTYRAIITDPAVGILIIGKNASGTDISGLNVTHCNVAGIFIIFSESVKIHENKIMANGKGIYLIKSNKCSIFSNVVNNNNDEGVFIDKSHECNIEGNYIQYNYVSGLEVYGSNDVSIYKNNISWNGKKYSRNWNLWLEDNNKGISITENNFFDCENYSRLRFWQSSRENNWNDNYWNTYSTNFLYRFSGGRLYGIWGRNSIVLFKSIPWFTLQMDRSPQETPYNYTCPVI